MLVGFVGDVFVKRTLAPLSGTWNSVQKLDAGVSLGTIPPTKIYTIDCEVGDQKTWTHATTAFISANEDGLPTVTIGYIGDVLVVRGTESPAVWRSGQRYTKNKKLGRAENNNLGLVDDWSPRITWSATKTSATVNDPSSKSCWIYNDIVFKTSNKLATHLLNILAKLNADAKAVRLGVRKVQLLLRQTIEACEDPKHPLLQLSSNKFRATITEEPIDEPIEEPIEEPIQEPVTKRHRTHGASCS